MKNIIFTLTIFTTFLTISNLYGQACAGGSGPGVCTPTGGPSSGGFEDPSTTPCIVQGTPYSHALQFSMFTVFNFLGSQNVDSIRFVAIDNLPCGMCWAVDQTDKTYLAGEDGCISITGTTNDQAGQYKLALQLSAWINGQANAVNVPATLVDQTGIRLLLRVKTSSGTCVNADTSSSANNLTANPANCNVGVNELETDFSSVNIIPNPMISDMTLSFVSARNASYTFTITDVTGKLLSSKFLDVKQGYNSVLIERENLSAGVYFIAVSDGKNILAKRFSVTD